MSRRFSPVILLCCLVALLLGCQSATDSQISERPAGTPATESGDAPSDVANLTLVTLKVPNMS